MEPNTFLHHLRENDLLSSQQLQDAASALYDGISPEDLGTQLVEQKVLTPFQLKNLFSDQPFRILYGKYRLLDHLGKGGFGNVFKALHSIMRREVAIKVIIPELVEDESAKTWFKREVLAATQLTHPNIVLAFDADEVDDNLFFVMEYVDGPTLDALVKTLGPLPLSLAWEMMRQCAEALVHADEKGMVHRDMKPSNCLIPFDVLQLLPDPTPAELERKCLIKITDFGLARIQNLHSERSVSRTRNGFLGTPDYVAPEQAQNARDADRRSDLYSLGCTFYFALTGRKPFKCDNAIETILKHVNEEPEAVEEYRPELPNEAIEILRRLMQKNPADRFQTPGELAEALGKLIAGSTPRDSGKPQQVRFSDDPPPLTSVPFGSGSSRSPLGYLDDSNKPCEVTRGADCSPPLPDLSASKEPRAASSRASGNCTSSKLLVAAPKAGGEVANGTARIETPHHVPSETVHPLEESSVDSEVLPRATSSEQPVKESETLNGSPETLHSTWKQWFAVLQAVVNGRKIPLTEMEYQRVYSKLIRELRCLGNDANQTDASRFRWLESLVDPWVSTRALARADEKDLDSIWEACHSLDSQFRVEAGEDLDTNWPMLLLAFGLVTAMVLSALFLL